MRDKLDQALASFQTVRADKFAKGQRNQYEWEEYIRVCGKIEAIELALHYLNQEEQAQERIRPVSKDDKVEWFCMDQDCKQCLQDEPTSWRHS